MAKRWTWVAWGLLALGLLGNAAGVALSVAIGFLATFHLLGAKPLPVLRRE